MMSYPFRRLFQLYWRTSNRTFPAFALAYFERIGLVLSYWGLRKPSYPFNLNIQILYTHYLMPKTIGLLKIRLKNRVNSLGCISDWKERVR